MIFEPHSENRIAYKRISQAELGRTKSHMTHIGLSIESLSFMDDNKHEYRALLMYEDSCENLTCDVGKITRNSGKKNSPKISSGKEKKNVVHNIKFYANQYSSKKFYLVWFGLESSMPLFFLIKEGSDDYKKLNKICHFNRLKDEEICITTECSKSFPKILAYIREKMKTTTVSLEKDIVRSAEKDDFDNKYKEKDFNKAKKHIIDVGKRGEVIINEYLCREKAQNKILDYTWENKDGEKKKAYDFSITTLNHETIWVDVKATEYEYDYPFIISQNELKFITEKKAKYCIYRVFDFDIEKMNGQLRICSEMERYANKLSRDLKYFKESMDDYNAAMILYKIAIKPDLNFFSMTDPIKL